MATVLGGCLGSTGLDASSEDDGASFRAGDRSQGTPGNGDDGAGPAASGESNGSHVVRVVHHNVTMEAGAQVASQSFTYSERPVFALARNFTKFTLRAEWNPTYPTNEQLRVSACNDGDCPAWVEGSSPLVATVGPGDLAGGMNGSIEFTVGIAPSSPAGVVVEQPVHVTVTVWGPR